MIKVEHLETGKVSCQIEGSDKELVFELFSLLRSLEDNEKLRELFVKATVAFEIWRSAENDRN